MSNNTTAESSTLAERIGRGAQRSAVIADCVALVDSQVQAKSGLSGVAIKGAYGAVKRIKPGFISEVVEALLDEWLAAMEPFHASWRAGGGGAGFAEYMAARSDDVAEALLAVTDRRAERSKHTTVKKAYEKLRGSAKKNVAEAVPELGRLVERQLGAGASAGTAA
jgi:hypothetical protein